MAGSLESCLPSESKCVWIACSNLRVQFCVCDFVSLRWVGIHNSSTHTASEARSRQHARTHTHTRTHRLYCAHGRPQRERARALTRERERARVDCRFQFRISSSNLIKGVCASVYYCRTLCSKLFTGRRSHLIKLKKKVKKVKSKKDRVHSKTNLILGFFSSTAI
jgi:hypothetical protein